MNLAQLPTDVFLDVSRFLEVKDILALRQTSTSLRDMTYERSIWFDILQFRFIQRRIPVPNLNGLDSKIAELSSRELEAVIIRAWRLRRNWTSSTPRHTKEMSFKMNPHPAASGISPPKLLASGKSGPWKTRCLAMYFLPGRGNNFLITLLRREDETLLGPQAQRSYELQCWDLSDMLRHGSDKSNDRKPHTECIARYPVTGLLAVCVNADPAHPACITVTQYTEPVGQPVTTFALSLDFASLQSSKGSTSEFAQYSSFPSVQTAVRLEGDLYFATDESYQIQVTNIDSSIHQYVLTVPILHDDPTVFREEYRPINSLKLGTFMVIFCQQWIHLYDLSAEDEVAVLDGPTQLPPVSRYKWRWRIDTLEATVLSPPPQSPQCPGDARLRPISILLRFGSIFPWPVNMLHHYILPPNAAFNPASPDSSCRVPYLPPSAEDPTWGVLPQFEPYMVDPIASPVRIFIPTDATLGKYGTALWLDAQTDGSAVAQAGDRGQRIAGRVLRYAPRDDGGDPASLPRHAVDLEGTEAQDPSSSESEQTGASVGGNMVFHIQEDRDDWARIAMCEEEGLIAVASTDGGVTVYGYA